jgi:hypothetical protein
MKKKLPQISDDWLLKANEKGTMHLRGRKSSE